MAENPNADDTAEQVAKLRAQVETLMRERVTPALAEAAARAETAMGAARHQAESLSDQVRAQPLSAMLIAAAIGFFAGRILH